MRGLRCRVAAAQRWLTAIYGLDLELEAEHFLVSAERARELLPEGSPRSGVLVMEDEGEIQLGLYLDPTDARDAAAIVEETSHLICLIWHAARGRAVSRLHLELQAEVDRYAVARASGRDALAHFAGFRWDDWMDAHERQRYETAHRAAQRYCRGLEARFPDRQHTPAWLSELRRFYRASPDEKLRAA